MAPDKSSSDSVLGPSDASTKPALGVALVEFEFGLTVRPCDVRESADERLLAVGFRNLSVSSSACESVLFSFAFGEQRSKDLHLIYGFHNDEVWGTWSDGNRSCLLIALPIVSDEELTFSLDHSVVAASAIPTKVWVNGVLVADVLLTGATAHFVIPRNIRRDQTGENHSLNDDGQPKLTIVIVNFQHWALTAASFLSVLASKPRLTYEVLIVDNGSDATNFMALQALNLPVRLLRLEHRRSFGEANTKAIEASRGSLLLLLNSDAFVTQKCIDLLEAALLSSSDIGAAGPIFTFPDGRVQEAGAFINRDASITQRGHGEPDRRSYDALVSPTQSVDYVSAACLMIRKEDFVEWGGFDPAYEPGYYEDSDFCCRLRAVGLETLLVEGAHCIHLQGATLKRLPPDDVWRAPSLNRLVFASRWRSWLWSKDDHDLPKIARRSVDEWRRLVAGLKDVRFNIFSIEEEVDLGAFSRSATMAIAALSQQFPLLISTPTPYSVLYLLSLAESLSVKCGSISTQRVDTIDLSLLENNIVFTHTFPPAPGREISGKQNILYCPAPRMPHKMSEEHRRQAIITLMQYDRIVTDSAYCAGQIQRFLRTFRAPMRLIDVVHPPVHVDDGLAFEKEPLVLSFGEFCRGVRGGSHLAVLKAFNAFRLDPSRAEWRLVCVGDVRSADGPAYIEQLRAASVNTSLDTFVRPSFVQISGLLRRAAIVVIAQGHGQDHPTILDEAYTTSGAEVGTAIGFGCIPIVFERGAAAETCEYAGIGFRFRAEDEIAEQIAAAADFAARDGVRPVHRQRMDALTEAPFVEAWRRLLSKQEPYGWQNDFGRGIMAFGKEGTRSVFDRRARRAIVVLGMHRSGTSAMARVLALTGGALPNDLMPAQPDNPTGFWESLPVASLNDTLLARLDSHWRDIFSFVPKRTLVDPENDAMASARRTLENEFKDEALIVLKDPRISILQPLWDGALVREGFEPFYLLMVRDPFEVAASLKKRGNMPTSRGLLLWAGYTVAAIRDTFNRTRVFVAFEDLLKQPEQTVDRIERAFGFFMPKRTDASRLGVENFIDGDLRNVPGTRPVVDKAFELIERVYQELLGAARDRPCRLEIIDELEDWLNSLHVAVGPTIAAIAKEGF